MPFLLNHSFDLSDYKLLSFHSRAYQTLQFLNTLEDIRRAAKYTVQMKSPMTVKPLYKLYNHFGANLMSLATLHETSDLRLFFYEVSSFQ